MQFLKVICNNTLTHAYKDVIMLTTNVMTRPTTNVLNNKNNDSNNVGPIYLVKNSVLNFEASQQRAESV